MNRYPRLFSPLTIAGHVIANRVMMSSMGTNLADSQGRVTDKMEAYYRARAAGRPGIIVVEAAAVHPTGRVIKHHFMAHDAESLPGLARLAVAAKSRGSKAILQLFHGGRNAHPTLVGEPLAPSPLRGPVAKVIPRAMTQLEIEAMVGQFAMAAARAMEVGFDGVELHGGHEYLLHQFLTPYCNRRSDIYGGNLAGRARFALETVDAVRQAVGPEAILCFRLSGEDHVRDGMGTAEAAQVAAMLEDAGVNLISVTGGVYETPHMVVPPLPGPPGAHLAAALAVAGAVSVPVAAVGRINGAAVAEEILSQAPLVCVGRAFLADPLWLEKARKGEEAFTRPCLGCNQGCIDRVLAGVPITCVANPWLGAEEEEAALTPLDRPGALVTVIGGGPAGLEAVATLGRLGHRVVLFERNPRLGGQVLSASRPPGKAEFTRLVDYYWNVLDTLPNVEVRLNHEATVADVCRLKPAAVVVATGSRALMPNLPGAKSAGVVSARDVLAGRVEVGERVAVLGGGNLGSEVAHLLARQGRQVSIIEMGMGIGFDLGPARRYLLRRELSELKVRRHTRSLLRRIYPDKVSFLRIEPDGRRRVTYLGPVDTLVAAMGAAPREKLFLELESKVDAIFLVGDALSPARMGEATMEGARAAQEIHRRHLAGELAQAEDSACLEQAGDSGAAQGR